jgi:hypothetical protein
MPGYLSKSRTYQTIPLSGGYTATIQKLTKAAMDRATSYLLIDARQHMEATPGEVARIITDGAMDNSGYTTSLLLSGIVEWSLDDEAGNPLPMTKDTIENVLTAQDAATLVKAISDLAGGLDPNAVTSTLNGSTTAPAATP